jgi:ABC-type multidrug transport system ATPase subunit
MKIELANIGKRFKKEWIFRKVNTSLENGLFGLIGANGSGKSTLLKIIAQAELASEGLVSFQKERSIPAEEAYKYISFAAPYQNLPEQLTLKELLKLSLHFKPLLQQANTNFFLEETYLTDSSEKYIHQFSSGMKQRLKLGLALLSDTPIVLLDEPCSNLDEKGVRFYQNLIEKHRNNRLIVVATNEKEKELPKPKATLNLSDFKEFN